MFPSCARRGELYSTKTGGNPGRNGALYGAPVQRSVVENPFAPATDSVSLALVGGFLYGRLPASGGEHSALAREQDAMAAPTPVDRAGKHISVNRLHACPHCAGSGIQEPA